MNRNARAGSGEKSFMDPDTSGVTGQPDGNDVARLFRLDLNEVHLRAGKPSYSRLEHASGKKLHRTTMWDILHGNRVNLPPWDFVSAFVDACRTAAVAASLDPRELGELVEWHRHWTGAYSLHSQSNLDQAKFADWRRHWGHVFHAAAGAGARAGAPQPAAPGTLSGGGQASRPRGVVPPRLADFVGRDAWLARLHSELSSQDGQEHVSLVAIGGLWGAGKTQLAIEYAYRHASEYDLAWWIPCEHAGAARRAMAELRASLELPDAARQSGAGGQGLALGSLSQGGWPGRWLLIFDSADEPEDVWQLLPPAGGHVIVTSRDYRWEAVARVLEIDPFAREESIEFLRRRMPGYSPSQAHRLADAVGDLPLLLGHAAESRGGADDYLAMLSSDPLGLMDSQPSDYPATVAAQWERGLDWVQAENPGALHLLNCLAQCGMDPFPRDALDRAGHLHGSPFYSLLRDQSRCNAAIMVLRRAGLLRVDAQTLAVHPLARHMVGAADQATARRSRHDAHRLLAADPISPEDPARWRSYQRLAEHAAAADVEGCSDEAVRTLVVSLVRYRSASGDPHGALSMAERAIQRWTQSSGGEDPRAAEGPSLAMNRARAEALLAIGRHEEALQLQQETLAAMRSAPGDWDDDIIVLGRVPGACYRMHGRFEEALAADQESRAQHVAKFHRHHPYSFAAAGDVILDLALTGQASEAVREARQVHSDSWALFEDAGHPSVLFHRNMLARCLWLNGQYEDAAGIMTELRAGYQALTDSGALGRNHPWNLAHEVDFAVILRDSADPDGDIGDLAAGLQDVFRRCWRALGAGHPQTLAAAVALASILRRIPRGAGEAVRLLEDAERRYRAVLPGHPFTGRCAGYLAAIRQQAVASTREPGSDFTPLPL